MSAEHMHIRVDALTSAISPAVQKGARIGRPQGAEFALLLSMISESDSLAQRIERGAVSAAKRVDLGHYSPELVASMNRYLASGQRGELNMVLSWLDTAPVRKSPRAEFSVSEPVKGLPMAQAALLGSRYTLLEEIGESRFQATA